MEAKRPDSESLKHRGAVRHAFEQLNNAIRSIATSTDSLSDRLLYAWGNSIQHIRPKDMDNGELRGTIEATQKHCRKLLNLDKDGLMQLTDEIVSAYTLTVRELERLDSLPR